MVRYEIIRGLAIANSLLSAASLFLWTYNSLFFLILYIIGTIMVSISGISFFSYSKNPKRKIIHSSFSLGVLAWTLILISSVVGVFWNLSNLEILNSQYHLSFFYFIQNYGIYSDLFVIYVSFNYISPNSKELRPFKIGFLGSIGHIFIAITGFILGALSLYYSNKDIEYKQERERLKVIREYVHNSKKV